MLGEIRHALGFEIIPGPGDAVITLGQILAVVAVIVIGYFGSKYVGHLLGKRLASTTLRPDVIHAMKRVVFITLLILVALTALSLLGIPITAFAFATGAIAIAAGFGAQNILNNFISGWILMAERPIRIGDFIEIDGAYGVVEQVGNRSTRIKRVDGVHMLVPNSQLLERTVVNWTLVDKQIRANLRVGVEYGSDVVKVAQLILDAVKAQPEVRMEPEPSVVFEDFGDSALVFDTYFWCDVMGEKFLRVIRSEIRFRIVEYFAANGIVIAFPQRDVHLDASSPIEIRMLGDS